MGTLEERSAGYCCWKCVESSKMTDHEKMFIGMLVCQICGNKRCPKASDHTLDCTGSNEPNQPGSVYQYKPFNYEGDK